MSFDFGQFFNTGSEEKVNHSLVEELLKEATESFKQKTQDQKITSEMAHAAFKKKYGSPEKFLIGAFKKMSEPYEEAVVKTLTEQIEQTNDAIYAPVITSAVIDAARVFNMDMLESNYKARNEQDEFEGSLFKSAVLASALNKIIPDNSPEDAMIAIHGLLGIVSLKLGELTMQLEAQELAKEELK